MTNPQLLYTQSRPQVRGVTGSIEQTIGLPKENLKTLITNDVAAVVTFVNSENYVQHIVAPRFLPTNNGSPSNTIMGNSQDEIGMLAPVKTTIDPFSFIGILDDNDMDAFSLDKPSTIPEEIASPCGYSGQAHYLVRSPKLITGPFKQSYPMGHIDDVRNQLEGHGQGWEAFMALQESANSSTKQEKIRQIYQHPTIQADIDTFVLNWHDDIDLQGPAMVVTSDSFEQFPVQLQQLKDIFSPKGSSPLQPHLSNNGGSTIVHEITTSQDRQEKFASDAGLDKVKLINIGGKIDRKTGEVDLTTLIRAEETKAFGTIKNSPTGGRKVALQDHLNCLINETKSNSNVMDYYSDITLQMLPADALNLLILGQYSHDLLVGVDDPKQFTSFGAITLMPQDPNDSVIIQHIQAEEKEKSLRQANPSSSSSSDSRQLRVVLATLDKVKENTGVCILINGRAVFSIFIDYDAMTKKGSPSIFCQLTKELIEWMMTQIKKMNPQWRRNTHHEMKHLAWVYFMWTDSLFVHFGKFAGSLHNRNIITDPNGDLTKLDFSAITSFVEGFNNLKSEFQRLQTTHTPHTHEPVIARPFLFKHLPKAPADPPADRFSRQQPADRSREGQRSVKKQRITERIQVSSGDTGDQKALVPAPVSSANGLLILYEGNTISQALPAGSPACPEFVTRGFHCPRGNACTLLHWTNLSAAKTRDRKNLVSHLREKKTAYINMWKLGKDLEQNDPEFQGIIGGPNLLPSSRA